MRFYRLTIRGDEVLPVMATARHRHEMPESERADAAADRVAVLCREDLKELLEGVLRREVLGIGVVTVDPKTDRV